MAFDTVKAYSAASAESVPLAATAKTINGTSKNRNITRLMEFRIGGTPATTGSPTAVLLDIYRFNAETTNPDFLATWTILVADITANRVPPIVLETWGNEVQTRLRFPDGTAPTFTGNIQARALE